MEVPDPGVFANRSIQQYGLYPSSGTDRVAKGLRGARWERTCGSLFNPYHLETSGAQAKHWAGNHSEVPAPGAFTEPLNQP